MHACICVTLFVVMVVMWVGVGAVGECMGVSPCVLLYVRARWCARAARNVFPHAVSDAASVPSQRFPEDVVEYVVFADHFSEDVVDDGVSVKCSSQVVISYHILFTLPSYI